MSAALIVTMAPGRVLDLTGCVLDGTGHECALKITGDGGILILPAETWIGGLDLSEAGPNIDVVNHGLTIEGRGHKYGIKYGPPRRVRPGEPIVLRQETAARTYTFPLPPGVDFQGVEIAP